MNIFEQIAHNIQETANGLPDLAVKAMVDVKEEIIDLNVDQIEHGVGSDGDTLGEYASDSYANLKKSLGSKAPKGVFDFKLTGDFLGGFYTEPYFGSTFDSSGLFIDSRDSKTEKLDKLSNFRTFGIAPTNKREVSELILPTIQKGFINGITR